MTRKEILEKFQIELIKYPIDWKTINELLEYVTSDEEYKKALEDLRDTIKKYENQLEDEQKEEA